MFTLQALAWPYISPAHELRGQSADQQFYFQLAKVYEEVESKLTLIGATGIEDRFGHVFNV